MVRTLQDERTPTERARDRCGPTRRPPTRPARPAFALPDALGVVVGSLLILVCLTGLTVQSDRDKIFAQSTQNMKLLGAAGNLYQTANNNYLPLVLSYTRGFTNQPGRSGGLEGICTWSFGGKNNNSYWAQFVTFDVEAADRPLNTYTNPGQVFFAPAPPARLPATYWTRRKDQAPVFQDPSDKMSFMRTWPTPTTAITTYEDVGTSYQCNSTMWFGQLSSPPGFEAKFNEGTRRIAVGQGAPPSRFVWLYDSKADVPLSQLSPSYRLLNGYGEYNTSLMTFIDGHVGYHKIFPGPTSQRYRTSSFTFIFE
jgi:hypothetical protein